MTRQPLPLLKPPAVAAAVARQSEPSAIQAAGRMQLQRRQIARFMKRGFYWRGCLTVRGRSRLPLLPTRRWQSIRRCKEIVSAGDHVVTTALEHNSVLRPLYELCQSRNCSLTILSTSRRCKRACPHLRLLWATPRLLSAHASNVTGDLVDIRAAGAICHRHGLYFLLDAARTAGVFPIDMEKDGLILFALPGIRACLDRRERARLVFVKELSVVPLITGGTGSQTFPRLRPSCRNTFRPERSMRMGLPVSRLAYSILNAGPARPALPSRRLMRRFYEGRGGFAADIYIWRLFASGAGGRCQP